MEELVSASNTRVEVSKDNLLRMFHILLPPPPELIARYIKNTSNQLALEYYRYCKQGFDDTLRFLQSRYMISCTRCLGVASSYQIGKKVTVSHLIYLPLLKIKQSIWLTNAQSLIQTVWIVFSIEKRLKLELSLSVWQRYTK